MKETIENIFYFVWELIFSLLEFFNSKLVPYFEIIVLILFIYGCSTLLKIKKNLDRNNEHLRKDFYDLRESLEKINKSLDDIFSKLNEKR